MRDMELQKELDALKDAAFAKKTDAQLLAIENQVGKTISQEALENRRIAHLQIWNTPEKRFWRIVDKKGKNDCWYSKSYRISTGKKLSNGKIEHKSMQRFSLELHKKFSKKPCVVAKCGNNNCVNPNHLYYATTKEAGKAGGSKKDKVYSKKVANESRNKNIAKEYKMYVKKNKTNYGALNMLSKKYNLKKPVLSTIVKKYS